MVVKGCHSLWELFMRIFFAAGLVICGSSASYFFYLVTDYNYFSVVNCRPNICTLFVVQMKCFRPKNKQLRCLEICTKSRARNARRKKLIQEYLKEQQKKIQKKDTRKPRNTTENKNTR